jgi:hypothetical protein
MIRRAFVLRSVAANPLDVTGKGCKNRRRAAFTRDTIDLELRARRSALRSFSNTLTYRFGR